MISWSSKRQDVSANASCHLKPAKTSGWNGFLLLCISFLVPYLVGLEMCEMIILINCGLERPKKCLAASPSHHQRSSVTRFTRVWYIQTLDVDRFTSLGISNSTPDVNVPLLATRELRVMLLPSIYLHRSRHHHRQHRDVPTSCMTSSFYVCNVYLLNRCYFNFVAPLSLQVLKQKVLFEVPPHHAFSSCHALRIHISCHNGFYHCNRANCGYLLLVLLDYIRTS